MNLPNSKAERLSRFWLFFLCGLASFGLGISSAGFSRAAEYEPELFPLNGSFPVEADNLSDFIRFGLQVAETKTPAGAVKLWLNYGKTNPSVKTEVASSPNARMQVTDNVKVWGTSVEAIWQRTPNEQNPKPRGFFRKANSDEKAFLEAVQNFARKKTGFKTITKMHLEISQFIGTPVTFGTGRIGLIWTVTLTEGGRDAECFFNCFPCTKKEEGLQLGKTGIRLLRHYERAKDAPKGKDWESALGLISISGGNPDPPEDPPASSK
jgi:hypothetical protein